MSKFYTVVRANGAGTVNLSHEELSQVEPKNITRSGGTVFFKLDDGYVSMKSVEFNEVFK